MRQGKKTFRHESLQDRESIQALLKAISQGIAKGKLALSDEDGEMIMRPEGVLQMKVSATQDEERHRINLRITWQVEAEKPKKSKNLKVKVK
jgi:amphi-Trp domain-containing protein